MTRALEAVTAILAKGLPDKDRVYADRSLPEDLDRLAAAYTAWSGVGVGAGVGAGGAGDRLFRVEVARLAHGLADVADRLRLAAALRKARGEAGFSIRELSRFSGVDHTYISRIERGAVPPPSAAVMDRLAAPLGVTHWTEASGATAEDGAATAADGAATGHRVAPPDRPGPDLAELGLHRSAVRSLLKAVRDLPDEHLELLETQAVAMRRRKARRSVD